MNIQIINNLILESTALAEEITQQAPSSTLDVRIADLLERVRPFALQTIESPAKQQELKESLDNLRTACAGYKPITSDPSLLNLSERITQFIKPLLKLEGKQGPLLNITEYLTHEEMHALSAVSKDQRIIAAKEKIKRLNAGISAKELGLTEHSLIELLKLQKTGRDFPVLVHLNVSNFVSFNLQSILDEIPPTITHLTARHCNLSCHEVQQIANSPYLTNLSHLDLGTNSIDLGTNSIGLGTNSIGSEGAVAIANSPHLTNLSHLDLSGNWIRPEGAVAIANSPHLTHLSYLDLRKNCLGPKGAVAIANSLHLTNLSHLDLSLNRIGLEGAAAIANSPQLTNLLYLDLGLNRIGSEGAVAIANSPNLTNLSLLDLRWNNIRSEGTVAIANSPHLTNLSLLNLRWNSIGSEGTVAIASSPHLTKLSHLSLENNNIRSEEASAIITNSPFLISLRILDDRTVRFK